MEAEASSPQVIAESPVGPGKRRRLGRLSDAEGRFSMVAIDQRTSLERMLAGQAAGDELGHWIRLLKRVVSAWAAPSATALLTDPEFAYPDTLDVLPPTTGLILAVEISGYGTVNGHERRSRLLDGFGPADALRSGADAVKLLIYHNPEVSQATASHQQEIVRRAGRECRDAGIPFVLEIVTYGLGISRSSEEYVRRKPEYVLDGVRTYSDPEYGVDLFKVQFPGDLRYTEEYLDRPFAKGHALTEESTVLEHCRQLDGLASAPWVLLSAGVQPEEFVLNLQIASRAGASGFLCGRALWKDVVELLPDEEAMRRLMERVGPQRLEAMREAVREARPWFDHPRYHQALPTP